MRKTTHHLVVVAVLVRLQNPLLAAVFGAPVTASAASPAALTARVKAANPFVCDAAEAGAQLTCFFVFIHGARKTKRNKG